MIPVIEAAATNDKIEKGPLWGTKQTFFRRKEIRVSLLPSIKQFSCHFILELSFLKKPCMGADFIAASILGLNLEVQFFVLSWAFQSG
jgi:hypothetical protein